MDGVLMATILAGLQTGGPPFLATGAFIFVGLGYAWLMIRRFLRSRR